jgi:hypothetical protein
MESAYDLIAQSARVRDSLILLKDRFPNFVVEDAVRTLAGVDGSCEVSMRHVDEALQSVFNTQDAVAVGEAAIDLVAMHSLRKSCPELGLDSLKALSETRDPLVQENLRLMMFYNNVLQFWKGSDLSLCKRKILDSIKKNITKLAMRMQPGRVIKQRDVNVMHHITKSLTDR